MSPRFTVISSIVGAVLALGTVFAIPAAALPGEGPQGPLCPSNYVPVPHQPAVGTLCLYVGPGHNDKDLHAAARISPILCLHVAIGTDNEQRQLVRTVRCSPTKTEPTPVPAPAPAPAPLPPAPAPVVVPNSLPVTG